jgi:hypothetical protein
MSDFSVKQSRIIDLAGRLPNSAAELEPDKAQQGAAFDLRQEVDSGAWKATSAKPRTHTSDSYEFEDGTKLEIYDPTPGSDSSDAIIYRSSGDNEWEQLSPDQDPI